MRIHLLIIAALLALAGCGGGATISQNQCIASDWQTLGYRDGINGVNSSQLLAHQDACVQHGIIPDREGYMLGWREGIREYCQPYNAFTVGERGVRYDNICPNDMQADFIAAYKDGRALYKARAEVNRLQNLIARNESRREHIKAELLTTAAEQLNPMMTTQERVALLARMQRLNEEQRRIRRDLPHQRYELQLKTTELESLNRLLASATY
jgi:hypothetical protein